jgi:hypothetical protein
VFNNLRNINLLYMNHKNHRTAALSTLDPWESDIEFKAWFGEREEMRSQPGLHFLAQQLPNEIFQRSFKIGDTNVSIDVKPLQLLELIQMCGIDFVSAVSRSGSNGLAPEVSQPSWSRVACASSIARHPPACGCLI